MASVQVFADADELSDAAADLVVLRAAAAIASDGRFTLVLSGGSTPRRLYGRLASPRCRDRIEWAQVHLFWGDERCVPPADAASNYRMAREVLIDHVPIPPAQVHRIRGEADPATAAAEYEWTLRSILRGRDGQETTPPGFDVVLLGLGRDGHTASLFPGKTAGRETTRWVVAEYVEPQAMWRVTLTPPLINAAQTVVFLVAGPDKAEALAAALEGPATPDVLPAQRIKPGGAGPLWMVDRAAAARLAGHESP